MFRIIGRTAALLLLCSTLIGSLGYTQTFTLATYSRDGKPFPIALALRENSKSQFPNGFNLLPTAGGVDNLRAIREGRAQAAFANAAAAYEASWGFGSFTNAPVGVRTISTLYPHNLHVVARADSGLRTISDLRGKRVSTGAKGSGSEQIAFRLLEIVGLRRDTDLKTVSAGLSDSIAELQAGQIDAFIFGSAAPVEAIAKLAQTLPIRLLESAQFTAEMNRRFGRMYAQGTIGAYTYAGQHTAIATLDVWDLLVVDEKMSVDVAYRLAQSVDEQRTRLSALQPSIGRVTARDHSEISPIALHLGAQLFLAEKGIAPFNRLYRVNTSNSRKTELKKPGTQ
jgi:uncharacterized protein